MEKNSGDSHVALSGKIHFSQREVLDSIKNYIIDLNGPKNPDLKNDATKTTDKCLPCKGVSIDQNLKDNETKSNDKLCMVSKCSKTNQKDFTQSNLQSIVDSTVEIVKPINFKKITQSSSKIVLL